MKIVLFSMLFLAATATAVAGKVTIVNKTDKNVAVYIIGQSGFEWPVCSKIWHRSPANSTTDFISQKKDGGGECCVWEFGFYDPVLKKSVKVGDLNSMGTYAKSNKRGDECTGYWIFTLNSNGEWLIQ